MDYSDVDPAAYYAEAIRWASAEGVAGGYGGGMFGPDDPITREQLAVMLHRYAQHEGYDVSVGEDTNILSYTDAFDGVRVRRCRPSMGLRRGDHPRHRRRQHPHPPGRGHPRSGGGDADAIL